MGREPVSGEEFLPREIPSELHSAYEKGPFRKCSVCDRSLAEEEVLYEIQKVFRRSEVIFEYAVCQPCGMDLLRSYSRESLRAVREFFATRFKPREGFSHCHFCGVEASAVQDEYSVLAVCMSTFLLAPPVVLCSACNESLNERLSKKTREAFGDFIDTHFPGIPADWEVPVAPMGI